MIHRAVIGVLGAISFLAPLETKKYRSQACVVRPAGPTIIRTGVRLSAMNAFEPSGCYFITDRHGEGPRQRLRAAGAPCGRGMDDFGFSAARRVTDAILLAIDKVPPGVECIVLGWRREG